MTDAAFQLAPGNVERDIFSRARRLTLESYDFNEAPCFDRSAFEPLVNGALLDTGGNAIIFGKYGTGKSHLGYALAAKEIQRGKTVRVIDDGGTKFGDNRLLEPLDYFAIAKGRAQEHPGPRSDLLHCDLLLVSDLPRNPDEGATLAEILLARFAARRSTLILSTRGTGEIVRNDMLRGPGLLKTNMGAWAVRNATERLFHVLNIGIPHSFNDAITDRIFIRDERQANLFNNFQIASLAWVRDDYVSRSFALGEPSEFRNWHLFGMNQRSYRHHPKFWMNRGIEQSKWPPETVAWLTELGPNYQPPEAE